MATISEKQIKTEDLHNYPFDAEIFRKTFNRYVRRFNTLLIVSILLISAPFVAYLIAWYLEQTKVDITSFLNLWHAGENLLLDLGFPHIAAEGEFASVFSKNEESTTISPEDGDKLFKRFNESL